MFAVLRGVLVAAAITVIGVAAFALILNWWNASDRAITAVNQVVKFVSILAGVTTAMRAGESGGAMRGACVGLLYMALGIVCYALMIGVVFFFPYAVFGLFTDDPDTLRVCMEFLPIAIVNFVCSALRGSMNSFTNGCGNYKFNFWVAILDGIVARIGFSLLFGLTLNWGYFGFWMGNAVAGVTPFVLGAVYYLSGRWKKRSDLIRVE